MKKLLTILVLALTCVCCAVSFAACDEPSSGGNSTNNGNINGSGNGNASQSVYYTVTFDSEGGSEVDSVQVANGNKCAEPDAPTKRGYSFNGWYNGDTAWSFTDNDVTADITLTASWEIVNYNITYVLDDGENNAANPSTYTVESEDITFLMPVKDGYNFTGWDIEKIEKGSVGNITVTASWKGYSQGLAYSLNTDGKSYTVTGIGDFEGTELIIPDYYDLLPVTCIGDHAFNGCSSLTSVSIGDNITSIGEDAFYNCNSVTSLQMSKNLTEIGEYAFANCAGLTSISIPDSVSVIGNSAFYSCTNLQSVTLPNAITRIEISTFNACYSLSSINIPDSVTVIGSTAFYGCSSLNNITFSENVTEIGENAFDGCTGLTSIIIPDKVTVIGYYAFYNCSGLQTITIGSSVDTINKYAFFGCTNATVTFKVTSGWKASKNSDMSGARTFTSEALSENASTYLTSLYDDYLWKRGENA